MVRQDPLLSQAWGMAVERFGSAFQYRSTAAAVSHQTKPAS